MAILKGPAGLKFVIGLGLLSPAAMMAGFSIAAQAQAPAAAPAAVPPKLGTVKAVSGNTVTVLTDPPTSQTIAINVPDGTKVQQLAVGSTDLKTATPSQFSDIAVGDRVLSSVRAGDTPTSFTARQVILMKSGDIAQKNAADQAEWRKNGIGGIVSSVDPSAGAIMVTVGTKKVVVTASSKTDFRRFAGDSVKFSDAKAGTLAQIQAGDQIQARGVKSADGSTVQAEEVVSGSFKNLSGLIKNIDPAGGKVTLKDLATKKEFTVNVTANSDIRKMPPQMATQFAARQSGGAQGGAGGAGAGGFGGGAGGPGAGAGGPGGAAGQGGARRPGGADLSQMIARLPTGALTDLKNGDAVMIVASEPSPGATTVTAITLLSGVEPILTANPNGGMNLSAWSMGGGASAE